MLKTIILYLTIGMVVGVSVAPNEALITGEVMEYTLLNSTLIGMKPKQTVYQLTIKIFSSKTLEGKLNFAQGENLKVYSKKELSPDLFGKFIKGKVTYSR